MKYVEPSILALATLCETMQKNQAGAKYLVALVLSLAIIGAGVCFIHWGVR
ncbi:hypothetical protein FHX57_007723 [Paraburkholderia tropica]|nr:hypothetical protein [Paraburkholderia tropica]